MIGIDCDNYIAILDCIDIQDKENNLLKISNFEKLSEKNFIEYITNLITRMLPGKV